MTGKALQTLESSPLPEVVKTREYFFETLGNAGSLMADHDYLKSRAAKVYEAPKKGLFKDKKAIVAAPIATFILVLASLSISPILSALFAAMLPVLFVIATISLSQSKEDQKALPAGETVLARFILDAHYVDQHWVTTQKQGKKVKVVMFKKTFEADWKKTSLLNQFSFFYRAQMKTSAYKPGKKTGEFKVEELQSKTFEVVDENEALDYAIGLRLQSDELNNKVREEAMSELDSAYQTHQVTSLINSVTK